MSAQDDTCKADHEHDEYSGGGLVDDESWSVRKERLLNSVRGAAVSKEQDAMQYTFILVVCIVLILCVLYYSQYTKKPKAEVIPPTTSVVPPTTTVLPPTTSVDPKLTL